MTAYYNEIDPYAAQWLRNLIAEGHIAPGDVDERSISDVRPSDLGGYTQCHFFAGIGVWSYALRRAGWPDDQPVWTGSCPCQPFSSAGAGDGFADERHLWPHWQHLIRFGRPPVVFGEQVAAKSADSWVDLVHADMEALGYAFGCVPFPAAGIGAPHIRDRNYWVADDDDDGFIASSFTGFRDSEYHVEPRRDHVGLDHHHHQGPQGHAGNGDRGGGRACAVRPIAEAGVFGRISDAPSSGRREKRPDSRRSGSGNYAEGWSAGHSSSSVSRLPHLRGTSTADGPWADADWLLCRDGKWRPVESGTFPLAHGAASRVGRLRAYGNAIVAEAATVFIESYLDRGIIDLVGDRSLIGHNGGPRIIDDFDSLL